MSHARKGMYGRRKHCEFLPFRTLENVVGPAMFARAWTIVENMERHFGTLTQDERFSAIEAWIAGVELADMRRAATARFSRRFPRLAAAPDEIASHSS